MKKLLLILLCLPMIFSSCQKEKGCTDISAINYSVNAEEEDGSCLFSIVGGVWNVYNIEKFKSDSLISSGPPSVHLDAVSLEFWSNNFGLLELYGINEGTTEIDTIAWFTENDSLIMDSYPNAQYTITKNELKLEGKVKVLLEDINVILRATR